MRAYRWPVLNVVSVVAVVVSVLFLAWQSHSAAVQTKLQVQIAVTSAGEDAIALLHSALRTFIEQPELRVYFYGGEKPPGGLDGERVATLAEMFADCVESGCETAASLEIAASRLTGWPDYGRFLLNNSPVVSDLVSAQPEWYPRFATLARG